MSYRNRQRNWWFLLTQLSLVGVRHLDERAVFFIVKDFHPLDITVHSCMRVTAGREEVKVEKKQRVRKK